MGKRVFLAHPKNMEPEKRDLVAQFVSSVFKANGDDVEIITGHDDYMRHAPSAGSFDGWARDVVDRTDLIHMGPFYSAIVITQPYFGKATATIVQRAIFRKRPVFVFVEGNVEQNMFFRVEDLVTIDKEDFFSGWTVQYGRAIGT